MIELKIPAVGESITEVSLVKWLKKDLEYVERDAPLCELESEKATFELNAEKAGILHIVAPEGSNLKIGEVACKIDETAQRPEGSADEKTTETTKPTLTTTAPQQVPLVAQIEPKTDASIKATPLAQAIISKEHVEKDLLKASGPHGRVLKHDVLEAISNAGRLKSNNTSTKEDVGENRVERKEKMSNLRKTLAKRLVEAKNSTAMLTTFNEVDMWRILEVRKLYKDAFKQTHGVTLGFMSFFTRACCIALHEYPMVNAYIDGESIILHDYCDISIAVSAPKGLVVPVIRNADSLSMAGIEANVAALAQKARDNKLTPDEMSGGTFTITNGGVFGSLMSTPILNIPQSAILGMHKIQERPVAVDGKVEIRPMMYVALSYDHRIIDGKESVGFLVRVKELLENPERLLLGSDPVKVMLEV